MKKVFKVADIRKLERQVSSGEISYLRMVEILNERAEEAYSIIKTKECHSIGVIQGWEHCFACTFEGCEYWY